MRRIGTFFCKIIGFGNFAEGLGPNKVYEIEQDV